MGISTLISKSALLTVLCLASWVQPGGASTDPMLTTLYSFTGSPDGVEPEAPLIFDESGALYGTTVMGGGAISCREPDGCGTVFKLTPPTTKGGTWTETVLHSFTGNDGDRPAAGLIFDKSGALYGTTSAGGGTGGTTDCPFFFGCGTAFKLTPPTTMGGAWALSLLRSFMGRPDGADLEASLIFNKSEHLGDDNDESRLDLRFHRALYGTARQGGQANCPFTPIFTQGCGTVFQLRPPSIRGGGWTLTLLHSFSGGDGAAPKASLIFDKSGAVYGTTIDGGGATTCQLGCGTVFKLTPPMRTGGAWAFSLLHSFTGSDGIGPFGGLIFDEDGALYGVAFLGGARNSGTVFKLTPPTMTGGAWTFSVLHSFTGEDGLAPVGELIFDESGALYGTTSGGGAHQLGTVFKLTPPATEGGTWTETVLHSFTGNDGARPDAGLIFAKSEQALYGTTSGGGVTSCPGGCGTVFKLTLPTDEEDD